VNKVLTFLASTLLAVSMAGCETTSKETVGGVTGAVVGGVIGHQIGEGSGKDLATAAGVVLGAVVGSSIGRHLDREDERRAQQVLEYNRTNQYTEWDNPDTGAHVVMAPTRTYQSDAGQYCREYTTEVIVAGKKEQAYGTACRQPDGSWKIVQ
jgi:surface antigen